MRHWGLYSCVASASAGIELFHRTGLSEEEIKLIVGAMIRLSHYHAPV